MTTLKYRDIYEWAEYSGVRDTYPEIDGYLKQLVGRERELDACEAEINAAWAEIVGRAEEINEREEVLADRGREILQNKQVVTPIAPFNAQP